MDREEATLFTLIEREVIVLKAVWGLIDDMVNHEMLVIPEQRSSDVILLPQSMTHQRLFNVLLAEFLSTPDAAAFGLSTPKHGAASSDRTYLFYLRCVQANPQLNPEGGEAICRSVEPFVEWLETEVLVEDLWFPSIDLETTLRVKRIDFLRICGNVAKHSFAGMSRNSKDIARIFRASGVLIDNDQRYLVIPEFWDWFHSHVLNYHLTAISAFLNNIRWGLYDYLRPEFERSFHKDANSARTYWYDVPEGITRPLAVSMYWDLMNDTRSEPYVPRFEVTPFLSMRY